MPESDTDQCDQQEPIAWSVRGTANVGIPRKHDKTHNIIRASRQAGRQEVGTRQDEQTTFKQGAMQVPSSDYKHIRILRLGCERRAWA